MAKQTNDNLKYYNLFREVPTNAKKPITGGRLNGMTDINPMWRIKVLTEVFGSCGEGWYFEVKEKKVYPLPTSENPKEAVATVDINLYYKTEDGWSKPVFGTGGSMLMAQQKQGAYVNDEAFKMALTDAISVAAKELGVGADVYWNKDNTKYNDSKKEEAEYKAEESDELSKTISFSEQKTLKDYIEKYGKGSVDDICESYNVSNLGELTKAQYGELVRIFMRRIEKQKKEKDA